MQYFALLLSPSDAPEERADAAALEAEMTPSAGRDNASAISGDLSLIASLPWRWNVRDGPTFQ